LALSHTVVSRQVADLEAWLGVRLVDRGPRGVRLTDEGQRYFAIVTRLFDDLSEATADLRRHRGAATLRIWCAPGLASRWLAPRLSAIRALLPDVDIVLRATDQRPDLAAGDADVDLRYALEAEARWRALMLIHPRMFPVAAPDWCRAHPGLIAPADLLGQPLIHEESREQWRRWFEEAGVTPGAPLAGPRLWDANLTLDAAASGQGIALATAPIARDDLAAGRLVEVLPTDIRLGGYWFAALPSRWNEPAIARLRTWMTEALQGA
jgi:DNA-binding transcriptional LysR family regulator